MDLFMDSHKFHKTEEGNFIHTRELGERTGNLYPESKWSDVIIKGVDIDDSMFWEYRNSCIESSMEQPETERTITVGEKKVVPLIRSSISGIEFEKGSGEKKTYYRKRKIPKSKKKNYSVKPIKETQLTKKQSTEEKYDEISGTMQFTTSDKDPGETMNTHVVFERDNRKYREPNDLEYYFHQEHSKYDFPRNNISIWYPIPKEEISTDSSPSSVRTNYSSTRDMISRL